MQSDSLVILPTFNEAANLARLVESVLHAGPFHVLIVDDNSPDGTGLIADQLAADRPAQVFVMHRAGKMGLGTAYVAGFRFALERQYQRVFEMDADFSHDPRNLLDLRTALSSADLVLGSRYVAGGATRGWPLWRRALSQGGSFYAGSVLNLPFRDLTGGFKAFRADVLAALDLDSIESNGYAFQIEVTYRAYRNGFRIVELPILFSERRIGRSKMNAQIVAEALLIVWRLRLESPRPLAVEQVPR